MAEVTGTHEIDDVRVLEVLNNPTRLRILRHLAEPHSVKELAEWMEALPTRLYYHVNLLEDVGVVRVVEIRKVGAMIEKVYQTTARSFRPSKALMSGGHDPEQLARLGAAVILDPARLDAEAALRRHFEDMGREMPEEVDRVGSLGRTIVYLQPEAVERVNEKIQGLLAFMDELDTGDLGQEFGMSFVFFPVAG
jgi:DNA-binding transcriptional ArsR family regulator